MCWANKPPFVWVEGKSMTTANKTLGTLSLLGALCATSSAISFTNISISGSPLGSSALLGSDGISFILPDHYVVGTAARLVTVGYRVTASAGQYLSSVSMVPNGLLQNATVRIDANHVNVGTQTFSIVQSAGGTTTAINNGGGAFAGQKSFYDVTTTIDLSATSGVAKVSIYNAIYAQQPVPEPASMAAILVGSAGFLARRRTRRSV